MAAYVVDGMNVIGARADGWWRDRDAAIRRLWVGLAALAARGDEVVLVLDGHAPGGLLPVPRLTLVDAAGAGQSGADDAIVAVVGSFPDPSSWIVVTSDRGLRRRLPAGVGLLGAGRFATEVLAVPRPGSAPLP